MNPILFDTSIYIRELRSRGSERLSAPYLESMTPVWLSAVVVEEPLAGASDRDLKAIERLERDFERLGRIVTPIRADWTETGRILSEFGTRFGYEAIGRGRLTNDALIATSSARLAITVVTGNKRDFERLAAIRPFLWELADR